ncbi:MAG: arginine--tRNA ligase [Nitrospiria bacterium]
MKIELKKMIESGVRVLAEEFQIKEPPPVLLEVPKKINQGDYSTPVAMALGALANQPPRKMAEKLFKLFTLNPMIDSVEIAGPGYLNFKLKNLYWHEVLIEILQKKRLYGRSEVGKGTQVQIEFVSANPTGPLHVGHGRGAVVGDALSNLFEMTGHHVQREYYINDVGRQVNLLGQSTLARFRQLKGENADIPDEGYLGDYITEIAREMVTKNFRIPEDQSEVIPFFMEYAKSKILKGIKEDLDALKVYFTDWFSEKILYDSNLVNETLEKLKKRGVLYESEGATWFSTLPYGDDKDRIVIKNNGEKTYYASDIAYHYHKFRRGFDRVINIWGADHHGYIFRVKAAVEALGYDPKKLDILLIQLVNLMREGKPVAMSKRSGEYVTLRDVINEVGTDATRFFFLTRNTDMALDFDLELAKRKSNENPVYYVQYAYARLCSVLKIAGERKIDFPENHIDLNLLNLEQEISLMKILAFYPQLIQDSVESLEPHRLSYYLQELAGALHQYYYKNRILSDNIPLTQSRLYLTHAIKIVLENALGILGLHAPERM